MPCITKLVFVSATLQRQASNWDSSGFAALTTGARPSRVEPWSTVCEPRIRPLDRHGIFWTSVDCRRLAGPGRASDALVRIWISDDDEPDANPARDTNGRVVLRAEARGTRDARYALRVLVSRIPGDGPTEAIHVLSWYEEDD